MMSGTHRARLRRPLTAAERPDILPLVGRAAHHPEEVNLLPKI